MTEKGETGQFLILATSPLFASLAPRRNKHKRGQNCNDRFRARTYSDTGVEAFGYTANIAGLTSYMLRTFLTS